MKRVCTYALDVEQNYFRQTQNSNLEQAGPASTSPQTSKTLARKQTKACSCAEQRFSATLAAVT